MQNSKQRILGLLVFPAVVLAGLALLRSVSNSHAPVDAQPKARNNDTPYQAETETPSPPPLAQSASPATAAAVSSVSTPPPVQLWAAPGETTGEKLDPKSASHGKARGEDVKAKRRSSPFDPGSLTSLAALRRGDNVVIPLLGGEQVTGKVNLVQQEARGWVRVGGELTGPRSGSFSFGSSGKKAGGTILLPEEQIAYTITEHPEGQVVMQEKPLSDVICSPLPRPENESANVVRSLGPQESPPMLSSRPGATAVLYLDFDGETVTDPSWNSGNTIVAQPSFLTSAEITEVWNRVKEDYWPFNIDVTTDPNRYYNAPVGSRMRCIITPTCAWYNGCGAGGVACLNSFDKAGSLFSSTIPCWVFNSSVVSVAEAASHELGHTFGLHHDGRTSPVEEYYQGHGTGAVGWGPIMGAVYTKSLVQWSKGEYASANNQEDDLAIIANAVNGFGYVADEAGNSLGSAAALNAPGGAVNQTGIISGNNDVDFYMFTVAAAGTVSINANPASISPDLDILLQLQNSAGTVLTNSNPDTTLNASFSYAVAAGTYYLTVQGTGRGAVLGDGYSSYGSIGHYSLSGTLPVVTPPSITGLGPVWPVAAGNRATFLVVASGTAPLSYQWYRNSSPVAGATASTYTINATQPSDAGDYKVRVSNVAGTVESAAVTLTVQFAPVITWQARSENYIVGETVTLVVVAAGVPTPTYLWKFNGTTIPGATSDTYTLANFQLANVGSYTVEVSNSFGTVTSSSAVLGVAVCVPAPPGLVGWWPAEGSAADVMGVSSGVLLNGATFAVGRVGQAFNFDGIASYIRVADNPSLRVTNALTITAWLYPTNLGAWHNIVSKWGMLDPLQTSYTTALLPDGRIALGVSPNGSDVTNTFSTNSVPPNQWTHYAATYDGAALRTYINGVCEDQVAYNQGISQGTEDLAIGAAGAFAGGQVLSPFAGRIDEPAVYNRALSASEIAALYNAGSAGKCSLPPNVRTQPANQSVIVGNIATFTVAAGGTPPLSYQWRFKGDPIPTASQASYTIAGVGTNDAGNYCVTISNAVGQTNSANATLTVLESLPGIHNTGVSDTRTLLGDGQVDPHYKLVVNPNNPASSDSVVHDSTVFPIVSGPWLQNSSQSKWIAPVRDTVGAAAGTYSYQLALDLTGYDPRTAHLAGSWAADDGGSIFLNGMDTGFSCTNYFVSFSTFTLTNGFVTGTNLIEFRVGNGSSWTGLRVENLRGTARGETTPFIGTHPKGATKAIADNVAFTVLAGGALPLNYQWRFNGTAIPAASRASLELTNVQLSQAGNYDVIVSNSFGSVTSAVATLIVGIWAHVHFDFETPKTTPVWLGATQMIQNTSASHQGTNAIAFTGTYPDFYILTELPQGTTNVEFFFYDDYGPNPPLYQYMSFWLLEATNAQPFAGFMMNDGGWGTTPPRTMNHYYAFGNEDYSASTMGPLRTIGWHKFTFAVGPASVAMSVDGALVFQTNTIRAARYLKLSPGGGCAAWGRMDDLVVTGVAATQPRLTVSRAGDGIRVAWPASTTGFVLQETISPRGNWTNSSAAVAVQGDENVAVIATTGTAKFYRLRR